MSHVAQLFYNSQTGTYSWWTGWLSSAVSSPAVLLSSFLSLTCSINNCDKVKWVCISPPGAAVNRRTRLTPDLQHWETPQIRKIFVSTRWLATVECMSCIFTAAQFWLLWKETDARGCKMRAHVHDTHTHTHTHTHTAEGLAVKKHTLLLQLWEFSGW